MILDDGIDERAWAVLVRLAHAHGKVHAFRGIGFGLYGDKKALQNLIGDTDSAHARLAFQARVHRSADGPDPLRRPRPMKGPRMQRPDLLDDTSTRSFTVEDFFPNNTQA